MASGTQALYLDAVRNLAAHYRRFAEILGLYGGCNGRRELIDRGADFPISGGAAEAEANGA